MKEADGFVALGVIGAPHGVKGAVKIRPLTASPDGLFAYGPLETADGAPFDCRLLGESKGRLLVLPGGISDRNGAEALRGVAVGVRRAALPPPEADEFYIDELIGLRAVLEDGTPYGTVTAVHDFGAGPIIELTGAEGELMLSFTDTNFPAIDYEQRLIFCRPPEIISGKP